MGKQDKIQQVYGINYIHSDTNGWIRLGMYVPNDFVFSEDEIERNENIGIWRHKLLQGIEDNNGWIKIESDSDFPNLFDFKFMTYDSVNDKTDIKPISRRTMWKNYKKGLITHYQPIQKPKLPIY